MTSGIDENGATINKKVLALKAERKKVQGFEVQWKSHLKMDRTIIVLLWKLRWKTNYKPKQTEKENSLPNPKHKPRVDSGFESHRDDRTIISSGNPITHTNHKSLLKVSPFNK